MDAMGMPTPSNTLRVCCEARQTQKHKQAVVEASARAAGEARNCKQTGLMQWAHRRAVGLSSRHIHHKQAALASLHRAVPQQESAIGAHFIIVLMHLGRQQQAQK